VHEQVRNKAAVGYVDLGDQAVKNIPDQVRVYRYNTMAKVVPCWQEALTRLHVGEKARRTCPPETAYGMKGSPPNVPPNATPTFEIELISVH
jgi:FKBP-type peptidyl-prolyl cis-trans isomerase